MDFFQRAIEAVRQIRSEMGIAPSTEISLAVRSSAAHPRVMFTRYDGYLRRLARVSVLSFVEDGTHPKHSASAVVDGEEFSVPLEGVIDLDVERTRIEREIERVNRLLKGVITKLENPGFMNRAPREIVEKEKEKQASFERNLEKLMNIYKRLT